MTRSVVVGSGAREHALAHALAQSSDVTVTPGNDGGPSGRPSEPSQGIGGS